MKKTVFIAISLIFASAVFAQAAYTPTAPVFMTPRLSAIGGYHATDTADYFTIFANPAGIPAAGKKAVWPGLYLNVGGPLKEAFGLVKNLMSGSNLTNELTNIIGDKGANASVELMGPLTFGMLGKNFGWGFFNKVYATTVIPSISSMNAAGGADFLLQFAYGVPVIKTENHFLSVGLGVKGIAKTVGLYNGSPLQLVNNFSTVTKIVPLYTSFGFGFDAGILYKFHNILSIGLTWENFYTPMWVFRNTIDDIASFGSTKAEYVIAPGSLNLGLGVRIPVGKADKVITDWTVMVDYRDFIGLFTEGKKVTARNPLLNLSAGMEMVLFKFLALRAGLSDMYFNAGVGFKMGVFRIDFAAYGKELGLEPGAIPQMNVALSLGFTY